MLKLIYETKDERTVNLLLELCESTLQDSKQESSGQFTGGYSETSYRCEDRMYSFDDEGCLRIYKEFDLRLILQSQARAKREGEFYEHRT